MKILNLISCLLLNFIMFGQNRPPDIIIPTEKNSQDYFSTYYFEGKTYTCDSWLSTYMQFYQSNHSKEFNLMEPIDKYSKYQAEANQESTAKFIFEIRNTKIFKEGTTSDVVEQLLEDNVNINSLEHHLTNEKLLFTGVVLPQQTEEDSIISLTVSNPILSFNLIQRIEFYTENDYFIDELNERNFQISISVNQLKRIKIKVFLKNNSTYTYYYEHTDCTLNPIIPPVVPPTAPPNPPTDPIVPIIPELDGACDFIPTYYNNPFSGNPYNATISYPNPEPGVYKLVYEVTEVIDLGNGEVKEIYGYNEYFFENPLTTKINRGVFGEYGKINTAVYLNPYHPKVSKPIIITDGIDFLSNRTLADIVHEIGGNDMISLLWDGGYDVIVADFAGGADFIQRNGFALIELIRSLRQDQGVESIEAIIGPSMGGQVLRHALLYWEKNLVGTYGTHGVKLMVSADSPWSGANASPAVQAFAEHSRNHSETIQQIFMSANSPAARQLLLHHTYQRIFNGTYNPGHEDFKTIFDNELIDLGSSPLMVNRKIAIADGSGNGLSNNVIPGENILDIHYKTCNSWYLSECEFNNQFNAIVANSFILDKFCNTTSGLGISCSRACDKFPMTFATNPIDNYDSSPGSPFRLNQYFEGLKPGMIVSEQGGFKIVLDKLEFGQPFTFVPTFSALGLDASFESTNLFDISTITPLGYVIDGSPFDFVFFDEFDSGHNDFSKEQQPGSIPFLLTHLNYSKVYETNCLIFENMNLNAEMIYDPHGLKTHNSFCLPFENATIVGITGNDCGFNFELEDGNLNFSSNNESYCESNVEICLNIEGCSENVCFEVHAISLEGGNEIVINNNNSNQLLLTENEPNSPIITFYPNPTNGTITFSSLNSDVQKIEIRNMFGKIMLTSNFEQSKDLSNLGSGCYQLLLYDKHEKLLSKNKIIIIH